MFLPQLFVTPRQIPCQLLLTVTWIQTCSSFPLSVLVVLWSLLTPCRRITPQRLFALVGSLRIRHAAFTQCKPNLLCSRFGVSIHCCLASCALTFFPVFVHPVCVSPPAYFPPHICCDAVAFSYLIPPCQRRIEDSHPNYVSCLTYNKKPRGNRGVENTVNSSW